MKYLMVEYLNGVLLPERTVDADFVTKFSSPETRRFFKSLGGKEKYSEDTDGTIHVKATSPDRETVRDIEFIPL